MMTMQPFNQESTCPKCGCETISATYHRTAVIGAACMPADPKKRVHGEHMCRECGRCGFGWPEIPADGGEPMTAVRPAGNLGS